MKIEKFEDLDCWKKARELANLAYDLTNQRSFGKDFQLRDQMRDAAGSVMYNIAEGFEAGSDAEFVRFLKISRRSASEVQSQLYLALDRKYITANQLQTVYNKATEVKRLLNGLIAYLRRDKK
jgi:four helix bundle protein